MILIIHFLGRGGSTGRGAAATTVFTGAGRGGDSFGGVVGGRCSGLISGLFDPTAGVPHWRQKLGRDFSSANSSDSPHSRQNVFIQFITKGREKREIKNWLINRLRIINCLNPIIFGVKKPLGSLDIKREIVFIHHLFKFNFQCGIISCKSLCEDQ